MADRVCGISQGGIRTTSPGLRMVTVLFPLETSIPTAFMIKTPLKRISNGQYQIYSLPIQSTGDITRTRKFNLRKTNAANEGWLADLLTDVKSWEVKARPIAILILTA